MTNAQVAKDLGISASEVSEALERCRIAGLMDNAKQRVNILALKEFLIHGLKYVFPVQPQSKVRGVATAISALPMSDKIVSEKKHTYGRTQKAICAESRLYLYTVLFRWLFKMIPCFIVCLPLPMFSESAGREK